MKILVATVVVCVSLLFGSCQKELQITGITDPVTPTTPTQEPSALVKTYTESVTSGSNTITATYNLSYDAQDRLISMVSTSNAGNKFVYEYSTNSYKMNLYDNNVLSIAGTLFLNSNMLVDSSIQVNDTRDTSSEKYIYNNNKYLVQLKRYERENGADKLVELIRYEHDANGNVLKEISSAGTITYTYGSLPDNLNTGKSYFAKNKNLVEKTTQAIAGSSQTLTHSYTFDSQNRQTSEKSVASSGEVFVRSYTY